VRVRSFKNQLKKTNTLPMGEKGEHPILQVEVSGGIARTREGREKAGMGMLAHQVSRLGSPLCDGRGEEGDHHWTATDCQFCGKQSPVWVK